MTTIENFPNRIGNLQSGLKQKKFTCRQFTEHTIGRIRAANPALNAIVVPLFENALLQADRIDRKIENGEPLGALFGVPVTIKECIDVEGTPTTWGLTHKANDIAARNDPLVDKLLDADAILIGKTNVQQMLLGSESVNPVYGRTLNPRRSDRTPGGSSGGEGAAVAAGWSMVGIGTDVGGSVRIPAHFCGVHGLKPTSGALAMNPPRGIHMVKGEVGKAFSQPGVLASSVEDLRKAFALLAGRQPESPEGTPKKLKIGFFLDDGVLEASPSIRRLVKEAVEILRKQGFETEEVRIPNPEEISRTYFRLMLNDAREGYARTIQNSEVIPKIGELSRLVSMPSAVRSVLALAMRKKQKRTASLILKAPNSIPIAKLLEKLKKDRESFLDYLREKAVDVIVCPPYPTPALKHGGETTIEGLYAQLFNYMGMPAGVVSLSHVREGEVKLRQEDGDPVVSKANDNDRDSEGLPIGVQVAAFPGREEDVLDVMALLERLYPR